MTQNFAWTDRDIEQLRAAAREGLSSSQIAAVMGHGLTRNAIIGKLSRIGETLAKTQPARRTGPRPVMAKAQPRAAKQSAPAPEPVAATPAGWPKPKGPNAVRFLGRHHDSTRCKMPLWDDETPAQERFICGEPVTPKTSWCPACLRRISAREASS